jgi:hypothetical protein
MLSIPVFTECLWYILVQLIIWLKHVHLQQQQKIYVWPLSHFTILYYNTNWTCRFIRQWFYMTRSKQAYYMARIKQTLYGESKTSMFWTQTYYDESETSILSIEYYVLFIIAMEFVWFVLSIEYSYFVLSYIYSICWFHFRHSMSVDKNKHTQLREQNMHTEWWKQDVLPYGENSDISDDKNKTGILNL